MTSSLTRTQQDNLTKRNLKNNVIWKHCRQSHVLSGNNI